MSTIVIANGLEHASSVAGREEETDAALRFYCEAMNGRQLETTAAPDELWFVVEDSLVITGALLRGQSARISLRVNDPEGIAARCWDAGFTVRAERLSSLAVIDPFGLEIDLVPATSV